MAANVLTVLKNLANKGKTIILTIHQPSSELFSLFDKILLMAEGRVAFLGTPMQATQFFNDLGSPCPSNYNPADYYVQKLAIAPNAEIECRSNIKAFCDAFAVSNLARGINEQIIIHRAESLYLHPLEMFSSGGYRASWWTQFIAILWRSWLSVLKEPMLVKVRLLQTTVSSHVQQNFINFTINVCETDGCFANWGNFLWTNIDSRWCYEHQRCNILIPNQYDISKRFCSY